MTHPRTARHAISLIFSLFALASCSDCGDCGVAASRGEPVTTDDQPPTVASSAPVCGASCVEAGEIVTVTFSEPMDPATIGPDSVQVFAAGGARVGGTLAYQGRTASFTPAEPLAGGATYRLRVTTGARDLAGNGLTPAFECGFSTAPVLDSAAPVVSTTEPLCGAANAPRNRRISLTFSEPMDPATIDPTTVRLVGADGPIAGTVSYSGVTALFSPAQPLPASSTFTLSVGTGARDAAGNALAAAFACAIGTGTSLDSVAPTVSFLNPVCGTEGVVLDTAILVTFSESMDPQSLTGAVLTVTGPGGPVEGSLSYIARTATFTPAALLDPATTYTVTVGTGATDLAGNALAAPFSCAFTTGVATDTVGPEVAVSEPQCAVVGVPPNRSVAVSFSEAMDPATVTAATFTVTGPGCGVPGAVICDSCVNATFTPTLPLAADTAFTLRISTAARDLAGNPLGDEFVCGFTTGSATDALAPRIVETLPANGAAAVCRNQPVNVRFSEIMDPVTVSTGSFSLRGPGGAAIPGYVAYDLVDLVATFTPSADLPADAVLTAGFDDGARDLAGLALAAGPVPNPWTFTTGASACPAPAAARSRP